MTRGAEQLFSRLPKYGLIVCKSCKYAVWPSEIDSHLSGPHHRLEKKQRQHIRDEVQLWQGLVKSEDKLELPNQIDEIISELAVHDGYLCRVEPGTCRDVFQGKETLRKHWRRKHDWTVTEGSKGGRRTKDQQKSAPKRFDGAQQKFQCQRFFITRHGSHCIRVGETQRSEEDEGTVDSWDGLQEGAHKAYEEKMRKSKETIEEGEEDDVNPWLSRTKWHEYLKKPNPTDIIASVAAPSTDPEKPEPYETVIWKLWWNICWLNGQTRMHPWNTESALLFLSTQEHCRDQIIRMTGLQFRGPCS